MRDQFIKSITQAAENDERVMLLTGDLGFKLFDDFAERFPDRFYNMGVCEANMVSVAAGLALEGMRPFTYSIVPFATHRCLEQIRNDVCSMKLPVTVTGVGAGFAYGVNGATHHGIDDIGSMRALPGITVISPCDPQETEQAVAALASYNQPAYLRLGRAGEKNIPGTGGNFVIGHPKVLREGKTIALAAVGSITTEAVEAASELREYGIEPLVLSIHTVKPIIGLNDILRTHDIEILMTIEEHGKSGGLFEAISGELAGIQNSARILGMYLPDSFIHECGSQQFMRKSAGLSSKDIVKQSLKALGK